MATPTRTGMKRLTKTDKLLLQFIAIRTSDSAERIGFDRLIAYVGWRTRATTALTRLIALGWVEEYLTDQRLAGYKITPKGELAAWDVANGHNPLRVTPLTATQHTTPDSQDGTP